MDVGECIRQPVRDHGVLQLAVAKLDAVAEVGGVHRLAHRLLAAGDHDLSGAARDRLSSDDHGPAQTTSSLEGRDDL